MDRKPAAIIDPIKTSHLFNPFNKYAFLETLNLPVVTELNLIGQGNTRTIESGIHTQSIVDRTSEVIQSNIITHLVTDYNQISLKSKSFPFQKRRCRRSCSHRFLTEYISPYKEKYWAVKTKKFIKQMKGMK